MSYDPEILNSDIYSYDYFQQEDICRLCWKRNGFKKIIEISSDNECEVKTDIMEKIIDCLDIDLSHNIHINKACDVCFNQINKFHYFKKFCQETDKKLREILNEGIKIVPNIDTVKVEDDEVKNNSIDDIFDDNHSDEQCDNEIKRKIIIRRWKYKVKRTPTYCNMCMTDFESVKQFKSHNLQYHGIENDGTYKCFGCDKKFKNRKCRFSHETHFCKGLKDGYKCSICDRYIPKRGMYEAHLRDHRDNVPIKLPEELFKCQKCDKLFTTMKSLKGHVETEHDSNKKLYVCESCGHVFNRKDYLNKHKLTHTGEKQHVCPHCGYRTGQRSSLTIHMRKHTGERPYVCSECPQRCVSSSNLRAHQARHLGVKTHECPVCHKKFGYKRSLQEHQATHAPAQLFPCTHCGAQYTHARGLRRHVAAKHADHADT